MNNNNNNNNNNNKFLYSAFYNNVSMHFTLMPWSLGQ